MITNLPSLSTQAPWTINCEIPPLPLLSQHSLHSYYVIVAFLANKNTMTTRSSHNKNTQTCSHNNAIISSKSQQCSSTSTWKCAMGLFMVLMINNWTNQQVHFISIALSHSNSKTQPKKINILLSSYWNFLKMRNLFLFDFFHLECYDISMCSDKKL
jgi:hypothetical protein